MNCDYGNDELILTKEYKYLLSNIRPLIDQLDKSRDAQLCLLWLSKLEQCGKWEKQARNQILSELCKQVKANYLKPPFSEPPPSGPLRNILQGCRKAEWKANESFDGSTEADLSSASPCSNYTLKTPDRCQIPTSAQWQGDYYYSGLKKKDTVEADQEDVDHAECFAIQKAYHERAQSDQMVIEKYQEIIKSLVAKQLRSDVSPTRLKKLQSTYENKIIELVQSHKQIKNENDKLQRKLHSANNDMKEIESLESEIQKLKEQVTNLTLTKNSLEMKFKKAEEDKVNTCVDLMTKLNDSEKKLKESEKRLKSLERLYEENCRIRETERAQKSEMERKYAADLSEMEQLLDEKSSEIGFLKEQLANQCAQFGEEVSRLKQEFADGASVEKDKKKIKVLKSKAKKLEKVREHMAVLFHSQLQQVIARKDFYIATLEMQLKLYTSEIGSASGGSDFHNSLIQKVSNLEAQYRKLLEDSEKQSIRRRQLDLQKIHNLEKQLLLCGGVLEDADVTPNCVKAKSYEMGSENDERSKADSLP